MKRILCIFLSLTLIFLGVSCTKKENSKENEKKTPSVVEEETNETGKTDEQDPPVVKHKITYSGVPDFVSVEGLPTEYIEGVGIDALPSPKVDNGQASEGDADTWIFVYWIIKKAEGELYNEVVTFVSKDEKRDLVLVPKLVVNWIYRETIEKWNLDIVDKVEYPIERKQMSINFPNLFYYAHIKIDNTQPFSIVKEDSKTFYKVNCDVLQIYYHDFLMPVETYQYYGNSYYFDKEENKYSAPYFIYIEESKFKEYEGVSEFIVEVPDFYESRAFSEDGKSMILQVFGFSKKDEPFAIIEECDKKLHNSKYFDYYPIVDGIVYLSDQSKFTDKTDLIPYIEITYKYILNKNLSDNPTFEEFDKWLKECQRRIYERNRYTVSVSGTIMIA